MKIHPPGYQSSPSIMWEFTPMDIKVHYSGYQISLALDMKIHPPEYETSSPWIWEFTP